jgi:hypothetical protein
MVERLPDEDDQLQRALAHARIAIISGIGLGVVSLLLLVLGWRHTAVFVGGAAVAIQIGAYLLLSLL